MADLILSDAPKVSDLHVWADFLELHCLASPDNIASIDDAAKEVKSQADNGIDTEIFDNDYSILSPDATDHTQAIAEDALNLAYQRSIFYSDIYPFDVDKKEQEIALKADLKFEHQLYIALLLCTNNSYCEQKSDVYTLGFEVISKFAFKGILPPEGIVMHIGTRKKETDCLKTESSKMFHKVEAIASELKLKCIADEDEFTKQNTGDGGIDLIGVVPMHSLSSGAEIVFLGQSATSRRKNELVSKQANAAYSKWSKWIRFNTVTGNYLFMSASIRQYDGRIINSFQRNSEAVLVDRGSIVYFISNWRNRCETNEHENIIPNEIELYIKELVA